MTSWIALALAASLPLADAAIAQQTEPLSAVESDPEVMGWMQGHPPAQDKAIRPGDPDFFAFPKLRWTVCHFNQMMPVVSVDRGPQAEAALPEAPDPAIGTVSFTPLGGTGEMTWDEAFDVNYSDGVIVLHHGRIVYERYGGCLDRDRPHAAMSVTKSITGLMAEALIAEGRLDESAQLATLIPELKESAFGDATVRQVLEMTTALQYSEDYADSDAEVWTYSAAGSAFPKPGGYTGPRSYYEALQGIRKNGTHGKAFGYKTPNADVAGWLVTRVTGQSVAEHFACLIQEVAPEVYRSHCPPRHSWRAVAAVGSSSAGSARTASEFDQPPSSPGA